MTRDYIISAETIDRYGDIIAQDGINTENFARNPVCLLEHGWSRELGSTPIGEWSGIEVVMQDGMRCTKATLSLYDTDVTEDVLEIMKQGGYKACSVGIRIKSYDDIDYIETEQGHVWRIKACELVEVSLCAIPANPYAVALEKGFYKSDTDKKPKPVMLGDLKKQMENGMHPQGCVIYKVFDPELKNSVQMTTKNTQGADALEKKEEAEVLPKVQAPSNQVAELAKALEKAVAERDAAIAQAEAVRRELIEAQDAVAKEKAAIAAEKDATLREIASLKEAIEAGKQANQLLKTDAEIGIRLARMHSPKSGKPIDLGLVQEIRERFKHFYGIVLSGNAITILDLVTTQTVNKSLDAVIDDFVNAYYPQDIARGNGLTSETKSAQAPSPEAIEAGYLKASEEALEANLPVGSKAWVQFMVEKGYQEKIPAAMLKRNGITS